MHHKLIVILKYKCFRFKKQWVIQNFYCLYRSSFWRQGGQKLFLVISVNTWIHLISVHRPALNRSTQRVRWCAVRRHASGNFSATQIRRSIIQPVNFTFAKYKPLQFYRARLSFIHNVTATLVKCKNVDQLKANKLQAPQW